MSKRDRRLSVYISDPLYERWDAAIPKRMRSATLRGIIELVCMLIEEEGTSTIGKIIDPKHHNLWLDPTGGPVAPDERDQ